MTHLFIGAFWLVAFGALIKLAESSPAAGVAVGLVGLVIAISLGGPIGGLGSQK